MRLFLLCLTAPLALSQEMKPEEAQLVTPSGTFAVSGVTEFESVAPERLGIGTHVLDQLARGEVTYTLSAEITDFPQSGFAVDWRSGVEHYTLQAEGAQEWSRELPVEGFREGEGAGVLGVWNPGAIEDLDSLVFFGGLLLVTPGPRDTVRLIDPATGEDVRTCPNLWEFQRAFMGPSVWSHYIARFGNDRLRGKWSNQTDEEQAALLQSERDAYEAHTRGYLLAGPVVNGDRAFFAVAQCPADSFGGRLARVEVHELHRGLGHVTLGTLPGVVRPRSHVLVGDGVVWALENRGLVHVARTPDTPGGRGFGGPDKLPNIAWSRRVSEWGASAPKPWLVLASRGEQPAPAFLGGTGYVLRGDPWTEKPEGPLRISLARIDLASGNLEDVEVTIPITGAFTQPTQNFTHIDGVMRDFGQNRIQVHRLTTTEKGLVLELVSGRLWRLEFSLE